ncbi:bZIP transcription factor 11-like [Phalaenopsis equestris]|uniref:bZIP transcription factor 11-like n=1 Tax=Phalaenopsis equestris TaxID=78828 RepID=UPI0009E3CCE7|nr:bZIP transcription factor 11-like [Phalaenopsis equestris]
MASTSSGSSNLLPNSGSEAEVLQALMDQKKRKRMLSNRESARRSRLRKQKHLDDLMAQVSQLKKDNGQIITTLNLRTQHYLVVEAENSVLRTQTMELCSRLSSLNEILHCIGGETQSPWNFLSMNQQPVMASSDIIQYYMMTT